MLQLDPLGMGVLSLIGLLVGLGIMLCTLKKYEVAVLLLALAPIASTLFVPNEMVAGDEAEAGIGSFIRITLFALAGFAGMVTFLLPRLRERNWIPIPIAYWLLGIFILLAMTSITYSIDWQVSLTRSLPFAALFAFLLGLYFWLKDADRLERLLSLLFYVIVLLVFVNLLSTVLLPSRAWSSIMNSRFQGLWDQPNTMGGFCMIAYPFCLWKYERSSGRHRWLVAGTLAALILMHILTGSRSSMLAAALATSVWLVFAKGMLKGALFMLIVVLVAVVLVQVKPERLEREGVDGFSGLTGRPDLWDAAYTLFTERPLLGYGYDVEGAVFTDPRFYDRRLALWSGSPRVSMHNGYISVAIGLGIVGLALWSAVLFVPLVRGLRLPAGDYKALVLSIMAACLVVNFSESLITGGRSFGAIVYWISWVIAERLPLEGADKQMLTDESLAA